MLPRALAPITLLALTACFAGAVHPDAGCPDAAPPPPLGGSTVDSVDLLVEIDNSESMAENQLVLAAQLPRLIAALVTPPDADHDGRPDALPTRSIHVGVIDQDLGTPGSTVPACVNSDRGDDGLLNPIHFGQAEQHHEPAESAPVGFRPADCGDPNQFPAFIAFDSGSTDPTPFAHDVACNAALYINGCGLEQQLEAVWRALIWNDASDRPGNTSPNAGFMRDDAVLAILVLSDEEDMSVVDCRFVRPGDPPCPNPNALDVFNGASTAWTSPDLNLRAYLYQPCGPQDPTWPLDRYVDPQDAGNGLFALKPGHPERIVFAAITGVPLAGGGFPQNADGTTNWDALLGTPGANGPDDFCGRNAGPTGASVDTDSAEGHVSMRQANQDPRCSTRTVPACRRQGSMDDPAMPACNAAQQYFAWPSRRIVEVARRFDQARLCNGGPCHNGLVSSICANDDTAAIDAFAARIQSRFAPRCFPGPLPLARDAGANGPYDCVVEEYVPAGTGCDASRGRTPRSNGPATATLGGVSYDVCDVAQVATDATGAPLAGQAGWYVIPRRGPTDVCDQRVAFTPGAAPGSGAITNLACAADPSRCP